MATSVEDKNKEAAKAYARKYRQTHREQINSYQKKYLKKWRAKNKNKVKLYNHQYYMKHRKLAADSVDLS